MNTPFEYPFLNKTFLINSTCSSTLGTVGLTCKDTYGISIKMNGYLGEILEMMLLQRLRYAGRPPTP